MAEETKKAVKMERIYADYEDKFVKAIMLYADDDKYLYYDADKTNAVLAEDLFMLFVNNAIIVDNSTMDKVFTFENDAKHLLTSGETYKGVGSGSIPE